MKRVNLPENNFCAISYLCGCDVDPDIIASIYEAAVIPARWSSCLETLAAAIGAYAASIVTIGAEKRIRAATSAGYREPYDILQKRPYDNSRVERFLARRHCGFETDLELCTQAELDADPLYRVALYPFGIGWTIGTAIPMPTGDVVVFDLCHRSVDGPFGKDDVSELDMYRPHLARSALLAARLGLDRAAAAVGILDAVGLPAAFVNLSGQVIAANEAIQEMGAIRIGARNSLSLASSSAQAMLTRALEHIRVDQLGKVRSIPVPSSGGATALVVHVVPLRRDARDIFVTADALVVVTAVAPPTLPVNDIISGLFDLTAAEANLAIVLAAGHDLHAAAARTGRSVETLRTQLKSLMSKTGTRRQADLLRLLDATAILPLHRSS